MTHVQFHCLHSLPPLTDITTAELPFGCRVFQKDFLNKLAQNRHRKSPILPMGSFHPYAAQRSQGVKRLECKTDHSGVKISHGVVLWHMENFINRPYGGKERYMTRRGKMVSTDRPWFAWAFAGISPRRYGFALRAVHVELLMDNMTGGKVVFPC